MNKKLMSSVLAGAMAVSTLSVAASAATAKDKVVSAAGSTTYKVSATVAEAEINVSVPGAMSAVVNPYGIEIMMKGEKYGAQGFTSAQYSIKNNTLTSAVKVSVTPTLVVPTTTDKTTKVKTPDIAVVATSADIATKETAKEKAIYAFVSGTAGNVDGSENVDATATTIPNLDIFDTNGAVKSGLKVAVFEDATLDEKGATHTKTDLMIVPKATDKGDGTVEKYGLGQIAMGGDVTNTNVTPWSKSDKLTVNLVLDIAPCADNATLGTTSGSADADAADVTLSALSVSGGPAALSPAFDAGTDTYTSGASQYVPFVVAATANDSSATLSATVDGTADTTILTTGTTLTAGAHAVVITVTNGTDTGTYTINVTST